MSVQQEDTFTPISGLNLAELTLQPPAPAPLDDLHQELTTLRAQAECLLQELQLCQDTANEQQRLIETLVAQLQQSQQRVQQLEQDQSFQQKRLQEQEAALTQEQQHRQELEARYYRQQQENLQLRQILHTHAPGTHWEQQVRLYQQPIPPWPVPPTGAPTLEPEIKSEPQPEPKPELTQPEPTVLMPSTTPTARGKKASVHLPSFARS